MDDEYLSDLTDVEEEEVQDALSPSKKSRGKAKGDASTYRIHGALNAPRATTYNAQHIFDQLEAGDIDLDAEYQRDVVWPTSKQIGLIDSVFRNFYIPPVIFAVTYLNDGSEKRVCIDGKQRLTSIHKFMKGIIPHKDVFTGDKFFYKENPSRTERGKLLPAQYKKVFANKQIVCIEYTNLDMDAEREIFQRVQLGMALTPAERLQAISSPASQFVRTLLALYVHNQLGKKSDKNKNELLQWDTARGTDFRCVASAVYCAAKTVKAEPAIHALIKWLQQPEELEERFCKSMHDTFKIFVMLAKTRKWRHCFNIYDKNKQLKVSPAEFITISTLIHRLKGKFTMNQLSQAIERMRLDIREAETDVRMNSRCFKHMFNFISELKASELDADPENDVAAVAIRSLYTGTAAQEAASEDEDEDEDVDELDETPAPVKAKGKATPKRKRGKGSDNEDPDYNPKKRPLTTPAREPKVEASEASTSSAPPSSAPPPYSSQPVLTDRLEAIRRAKEAQAAGYAPPPQQPAHPPQHQQSQQQQVLARAWPNIGAALGQGYGQTDVGRAIMERLALLQAPPGQLAPPPSMPYPPDPYSQQQHGQPSIPRMQGGNQYPPGDGGYQHRNGGPPPY